MKAGYRFGLGGVVALGALVLSSGCVDREKAALKTQIQQLSAISAEKDSLLSQVVENTKLMSEISSELARVKDRPKPPTAVVSPESPLATTVSYRDSMLTKIKDVTDRVIQSEGRLRASQRRLRELGGQTDSLKATLASLDQAIADFKSLIENQKLTIATLNDQVGNLETERAQLQVAKAALEDTVKTIVDKDNTVYYVVGTKSELIQRGVVEEEGGKFLFFGKKVLAPARSLDPSAFTAIDMRRVSEIPLPAPEKRYTIASRQPLGSLANEHDKKGRISGGAIQISSPEAFWAPSRYLIVVQQ